MIALARHRDHSLAAGRAAEFDLSYGRSSPCISDPIFHGAVHRTGKAAGAASDVKNHPVTFAFCFRQNFRAWNKRQSHAAGHHFQQSSSINHGCLLFSAGRAGRSCASPCRELKISEKSQVSFPWRLSHTKGCDSGSPSSHRTFRRACSRFLPRS